MTSLFKKPKAPVLPPPAPPPPTIDDAARTEELTRKAARRRGRLATMKGGAKQSPSVAVKTLLG